TAQQQLPQPTMAVAVESPPPVPPPLRRRIATALFALLVAVGLAWTYVQGADLWSDGERLVSLGLYGAFLLAHALAQSGFAYLEWRRAERARDGTPWEPRRSVAIAIAAFQEDPGYLRGCLVSVRDSSYPRDKLKVVMVVDGNGAEDAYMMELFREVFRDEAEEAVRTVAWRGNYHASEPRPRRPEWSATATEGAPDRDAELELELEEAAADRRELEAAVRSARCVCVMQQWGGKREAMYTAFRALGTSVDYVQVCDSDTRLHRDATAELARLLDADAGVGAAGGDVRVHNASESFISFLSGLRYWMAFNVERACQSYFHCVSCISGPLGLYRNTLLQQLVDTLLQQLVEPWYNQTFLGARCTFGDDHGLRYELLEIGTSAARYTSRARCHTETPAQYLRWLNQQTRWAKSYHREWLYNAMWWHKHHIWMTYESLVAGIFPFFVAATALRLFYSGSLWDIVWVMVAIQVVALARALYASLLRRNLVMAFTAFYSVLYVSSLVPAKLFAVLTIAEGGWGTSGRRRLVGSYVPLLPLSVWGAALAGGLCYKLVQEARSARLASERVVLAYGAVAYAVYWLLMVVLYRCHSRRWCCRREPESHAVEV
uniref:Hyaluronan synthase 1 n=1 Tax=Petromyzon marinus TaxID=7757 RepID=S4RE21_PETMA